MKPLFLGVGIVDGAIVDPHGYLASWKQMQFTRFTGGFPHHWTTRYHSWVQLSTSNFPPTLKNIKKTHHQLENLLVLDSYVEYQQIEMYTPEN